MTTTTALAVLPATSTVAALHHDMPAKPTVTLRDPDLYDEGVAYWIDANAVVSVSLERVEDVLDILTGAARIMIDQSGWTRRHPSHYGVEVDSHFDHGRGREAHDAHSAWTLALQAVTA